ncbi:hypothetical protein KFZ76_18645 [Methylovulum psychrotolerans]|uniref:glycoside hydrolase family 15 protein n=1 Tax=Methylovulum psychrotolerans TaxID=1704499 RepID=UPI001BFF8FA4|nr:glycoside hydrolase family 15 protein [Methylovulum psychrotolerans]MBT9099719.1 hypothetical protein [Methylovulum psychrotolerans]
MPQKNRTLAAAIAQLIGLALPQPFTRQIKKSWPLLLLMPLSAPLHAEDAPCPPGYSSTWGPAAKDFLGTSLGATSRVYFTGAEGILTEVFYPTIDTVQNVDMQFLVTDAAKTWGDEERKQAKHEISQTDPRAMIWNAATTADNGKWKISKKIFTDPNSNVIIQRVTFQTLEAGKSVKDYNVYLLNNPAINNSGAGKAQCSGKQSTTDGADNSKTLSTSGRTFLVASESKANSAVSALAVSLPWRVTGSDPMVSNGFVGTNDGYTDLFAGVHDRTMDWHYANALGGNVAQMGWLDFSAATGSSVSFDVVLGFGSSENEAMNTANAALKNDLAAVEKTYADQWKTYTQGLDNQGGTADNQYYLAAMTLKSIQDKSSGAMVAGPGTPWGDTSNDSNQGGYHLVWARDLFKFASALITAGDKDTANKSVEFLFNVQMETTGATAGRFPQNSFVDGKPYWNGTQMDESAMPIILAWKLKRTDLWPKIKLAAEFVAKTGPHTGQERWEEMGGYSPSTIAAEIAGLVCAADLATAAGDPGAAAYYLQKADEWRNNIANWTFTTTGYYGNKQYYVRIDSNQNPDDEDSLTFGNGGGNHKEKSIIDGGFLELVRMGAMSPNDWTILDTLPEYDELLKQTFPGKGDAFFRYNNDGYGENNQGGSYNGTGRGRLWPIFTAERGIYEIAKSGDGSKGTAYLSALKAFSSPAGFIPEQIWNQTATITGWETITPAPYVPGTATRSMQPLSWAMGEYINLTAAIKSGKGDAPKVVCDRYACDKPQVTVSFNVTTQTQWGENIYLVGDSPLLSNWIPASGIKLSAKGYPVWSTRISLPTNTAFKYKYVKRDSKGNTLWEQSADHTFTTAANNTPIVRTDSVQGWQP